METKTRLSLQFDIFVNSFDGTFIEKVNNKPLDAHEAIELARYLERSIDKKKYYTLASKIYPNKSIDKALH